MLRPVLTQVKVRPLPFYLAMEEWLAMHWEEPELFFTWSVNPTVIVGRHQDIHTEVNLEYCQSAGIDVCRRKSGGGAVFADSGNIMFSYICSGSKTDTQQAFARFTERTARMLQSLGINAVASGRNDIIIDDCKVSGNACYNIASRVISHGTMLHSIDSERMSRALTPDSAKLASHGVKSIRSRVTSISEHSEIPLQEFRRYAEEFLTDSTKIISPAEEREIETLALAYRDESWLYRSRPKTGSMAHHIPGVGTICVSAGKKSGILSEIQFSGDFLCTGSLEPLRTCLEGCPATLADVDEQLRSIGIDNLIPGLNAGQLASIIMETAIAQP